MIDGAGAGAKPRAKARLPALVLAAGAALLLASCGGSGGDVVVVYSSVDDVFARPIAEQFQEETGIEVRLVPDTEETKSTGLLNRLIAERQRPQADVFWSGDPARAALLAQQGVAAVYQPAGAQGLPAAHRDPEGRWTGFSARARVLVYNTDRVAAGQEPESIWDLLDPRFRDAACIANPLFGTTSMHAAALFQQLGEEQARRFFDGFIANGGTIVSSNGEVRRRVAAGDFALGITDTDDANVAIQEGRPVGVVYPDQDGIGTLIIPNAVLLVAGAPHPEAGGHFIEYLLRPETERALAESEAAQMPLRPGVPTPPHVTAVDGIRAMPVDYPDLARLVEALTAGFLKQWVDAHGT